MTVTSCKQLYYFSIRIRIVTSILLWKAHVYGPSNFTLAGALNVSFTTIPLLSKQPLDIGLLVSGASTWLGSTSSGFATVCNKGDSWVNWEHTPVHWWSQENLGYHFTILHWPAWMMQDVDALSHFYDPLIACYNITANQLHSDDYSQCPHAFWYLFFPAFALNMSKH